MTSRARAHSLPPTGVIALTVVVWAVQLLLGFALPGIEPLRPPPFGWPVLAAVFAVATSAVVHVHFRQESESFDLFDMPVVIGLMLFSPRELWLAQMVGTFIAVALVRRQPLVKALFNLGLLGMQTVITAHLFGLAVPDPVPASPANWAPLFIAILFGSLLNVGFIVAVVSIIEGSLDESSLVHVFTYGGVVTLTNTGLGLIASVLITEELALVLPLVIPVTALYLAYRAYGAERDQRARLEILYRSTRSLSRVGGRKEGMRHLLVESAEMFRARTVEFIAVPDRHGSVRRSCLGPAGVGDVNALVTDSRLAELMTELPAEPILVYGGGDEGWSGYLAGREIATAMVASVASDEGQIGVMLVGDRKGDVASFGSEDLRMMGTIVNHVAVAIERDRLHDSVEELRRMEESLSKQARTDPLTGLLNRSGFDALIENVGRGNDPLAIAFVDLDDFKDVNDTHGHDAGDMVLTAVAERILSVVRDTDSVARLGGDEFAIIFSDVDHPEKVLPRLLENVTNPVTIGTDRSVAVGASVGLAIQRPDESTSQTIRNADIAMYTAKASGKNTFQIFEPMLAPIDSRPSIDRELRAGVDNDSFSLHYQAIVDLGSGETVGFESLLRWRSDTHGLLLPADFLRDAQDTGAIIPIEQWAMRQAAKDLCAIEDGLGKATTTVPLFTTLNLSADHLAHPSAIETLLATTESCGIEPSRLMIEISENDLMRAPAELGRTLQALRQLGFAVAIDDFGSGDASLGVIKRNEVDAVKVARSVIGGLAGGERPYLMAMIELARNLDIQLIAEGVETEEQRLELMRAGITLGQGFYFARPLPVGDVLLSGSLPRIDRRVPPQALR